MTDKEYKNMCTEYIEDECSKWDCEICLMESVKDVERLCQSEIYTEFIL